MAASPSPARYGSLRFPARFMLVAAMNPTPKGDKPVDEVGYRQMERYLSRISGPLIDRIDIHVEVPAVPYRELTGTATAPIRPTIRGRCWPRARRPSARNGAGARPNSTLSRQAARQARGPRRPGSHCS